jgi:hypothetical protein
MTTERQQQGNQDAARGLRTNLCARLEAFSRDELRVVDRVMQRLELGRDRYGALDLAVDKRNWDQEADEERVDGLIYETCRDIAAHDRRVEEIARLEEDEMPPVEIG